MKAWKNHKTIQEARPNLQRRRCWTTCFDCQKTWSETLTQYVHMIQPEGKAMYVCDSCVVNYD